jgi:prevent-host-death family protein
MDRALRQRRASFVVNPPECGIDCVLGQIGQKGVSDTRGIACAPLSAKDAKYGFGRLIDLARAEPVVVAKHGRPVVVVMALEEYERLKVFEIDHVDGRPSTTTKAK